MWCTVSSSTCSLPPSRSTAARNSGPVVQIERLARLLPRSARSTSAAARPSANPLLGSVTRRLAPPPSGTPVPSSLTQTGSAGPRAAAPAAASARSQRPLPAAGPPAAARTGCCRPSSRLQLLQEPQPLLRERQRQPLVRGPRARARQRPASAAGRLPRARASPATVGASNSAAQRQLHPERLPHAATPPASPAANARPARRSRRARPTRSTPSSSRPDRRQHLLHRRRAAPRSCRVASCAASGAGSAFRSTLPFGVSGSASSPTNAAGTMYSGSCSLRMPRSSPTARRVPSPATT